MRWALPAYGAVVYALFLGVFSYSIGWVGDVFVPKTINSGPSGPVGAAVVVDLVLLAIFALQHSGMARPRFKAWWTRRVPPAAERSTYVLLSTGALALICGAWRPLPSVIWNVGEGWPATLIWALFAAGWTVALLSTWLIDHFDLFGLRQVWTYRRTGETPPPEFRTPLFYRVMRHPLYFGFLLAFWSAPVMTAGRLLFALAITAYVLLAIQLEERDLLATFGERYADYRKRVSMILPLPRRI